MIVVLEGQEGAGKSTVAEALSVRTGWPVLKMSTYWGEQFVHRMGGHEGKIQLLKDLGIPINTVIEDIFASVVLAELGIDAILDRSVPSGLAYGLEYDEVTKDQVLPLWRIWAENLQQAANIGTGGTTPLYVHFEVPYDVARERCTHENFKYTKREFDGIGYRLIKYFDMARDFVQVRLSASSYETRWIVDRLMRLIDGRYGPGVVELESLDDSIGM